MTVVLIRKSRNTNDVCIQRKGHMRTHEKVAIYKRREALEETNPPDTLILDS